MLILRSKDKPITKSRQFVQEAMDELKAMTNGIIPLEIPFVQSVIKNHVNTNGGKVCTTAINSLKL
jgi:hypothetical protein